jgi:hypothetical protein
MKPNSAMFPGPSHGNVMKSPTATAIARVVASVLGTFRAFINGLTV